VGDEVFFVHADAGVGDGEGVVFFVEEEVDAGIEVEGLEGIVDEGEMAELVQSVRGVGDEFAEEDLGVRVEAMDDELEELGDFGLKFALRHNASIMTNLVGEMKRVRAGRVGGWPG
jgi:hypothetical protein